MCNCSRIGKGHSLFNLSETDKITLSQKLPELVKRRMIAIGKNILMMSTDNLADYIFINGKIYTMDENNPEVEAVAVKAGNIIFAGSKEDALIYQKENTKEIDLNGKVMFPGFIDPHIHMLFTMLKHWLDLGPFVNKDLNDVKKRILTAIQKAKDKPNEWIAGQLFDPTIMEGQFDVSLKALDQLCPNNPLFIIQANGHVAHVNSLALKIGGLNKDTKDPPQGRFIRDQQGELTGQLQETAVNALNKFILTTAIRYSDNFKEFLQQCSSMGCTSLNDCGVGFVSPKADLAVLLQTFEKNPPVRYSGCFVSTSWKAWMEQKMVPDYKDEYLRLHGMKSWADGSTQGGSAFLRENYLKPEWKRGHANYTLQQLTHSIKLAHDGGWQVSVHANGDAAIDMVLDAFETVVKDNPKPELRHRIEHCTLCHKDQLKRMKQLSVEPSFLIGHIYYYGHVFKKDILGPQRAYKLDPMKSAIQAGLKPTMHSDYNCQPVDPLRCIYNAVTRKMKFNHDVLNPSECLTPYEALKAVTVNAAWQCHMEDMVGSIQKGKKADFVILDKDPLTIPKDDILHIKVLQTWMDGQLRYSAAERAKLESQKTFLSQFSKGSLMTQDSI